MGVGKSKFIWVITQFSRFLEEQWDVQYAEALWHAVDFIHYISLVITSQTHWVHIIIEWRCQPSDIYCRRSVSDVRHWIACHKNGKCNSVWTTESIQMAGQFVDAYNQIASISWIAFHATNVSFGANPICALPANMHF